MSDDNKEKKKDIDKEAESWADRMIRTRNLIWYGKEDHPNE
jgi:hypothetical protein